jgi:hypothetical protein
MPYLSLLVTGTDLFSALLFVVVVPLYAILNRTCPRMTRGICLQVFLHFSHNEPDQKHHDDADSCISGNGSCNLGSDYVNGQARQASFADNVDGQGEADGLETASAW